MYTRITDDQAGQLLAVAIDLLRLKSDPKPSTRQQAWQHIHHQLKAYTYPINYDALTVEQIPLPIRQCFVRAILLQTLYPQLGGQHTGGTYSSPIVKSYQCDCLPHDCYQKDAAKRLCQLFKLSQTDAQNFEDLLAQVKQQIKQQKSIIQALNREFNQLKSQEDTLQLFQALFGKIPLPEASLNCLTTEMQFVFLLDYQSAQLRDQHLWANLTVTEQQQISQFLTKISQFDFKQFANFPSFGYLTADTINLALIQCLIDSTGYSKSAIIKALSSSTSIIATEKVESFLLHDIWGHYWQSILTSFQQSYDFLSQIGLKLNDHLSANSSQASIKLCQLFQDHNGLIKLNYSLTKQFCDAVAQQSISSLTTHLIAEMLADINEYKWLAQNKAKQAHLNSSSYFKNYPTKLDLTLKDLKFLYSPIISNLTQLNISNLESELINYLNITEEATLFSLRQAIAELNYILSTEYIRKYQFSLDSQYESNKLGLDLLRLQNILNQIYIHSDDNLLAPISDLILLFTSNYYSTYSQHDLNRLNLALANYFYPCCRLLNSFYKL